MNCINKNIETDNRPNGNNDKNINTFNERMVMVMIVIMQMNNKDKKLRMHFR